MNHCKNMATVASSEIKRMYGSFESAKKQGKEMCVCVFNKNVNKRKK